MSAQWSEIAGRGARIVRRHVASYGTVYVLAWYSKDQVKAAVAKTIEEEFERAVSGLGNAESNTATGSTTGQSGAASATSAATQGSVENPQVTSARQEMDAAIAAMDAAFAEAFQTTPVDTGR